MHHCTNVIAVDSVPEREQWLHWCFGHLKNIYRFLLHDARHFGLIVLYLKGAWGGGGGGVPDRKYYFMIFL